MRIIVPKPLSVKAQESVSVRELNGNPKNVYVQSEESTREQNRIKRHRALSEEAVGDDNEVALRS